MLNFSTMFKLYLFKNTNKISWSIKISDYCVNTYYMTADEFENILLNWKQKNGYEFVFGKFRGIIQHKLFTPRPERSPTNYVRLCIGMDMNFEYRVSVDDMYSLETDYNYQKNNRMHWDLN